MEFILNNNKKVEECKFTKNGVNFHFIHKKSKKIGVNILFNNGKNAETYINEKGEVVNNSHGMAHFIEHLLFSSASENLNYLETAIAEKWGMNGATGENVVFYYIIEEAEQMLNTFLERVMKIAYTLDVNEEIFAKEKGIVTTEVSLALDDPTVKGFYTQAKYYGNSQNAHRVEGTPDSVNNIEWQEVVDYYKEVYTLENSTVCIAGDFKGNDELTTKIMDKFFEILENIRNNFEIHVLDKGPKREIATVKAINFDQKEYTVTSPKVSLEGVGRTYAINSEQGKQFGEELIGLSSFMTYLNPMVNKKVAKYFDENGFNSATSTFLMDMTFRSKYVALLNIGTQKIDDIDGFTKVFKNIIDNWRDFISVEELQQSEKISKYNKYKLFDNNIDQTLMGEAYSRFSLGYELGIEEDDLNMVELLSEQNIDKYVQFIDWENYITMYEKKEN